MSTTYEVGQRVIKEGEDSRFEGEVVCRFFKRNKKTVRYVIENDDGVLHIAGPKQLTLKGYERGKAETGQDS